jgi:predicted nuclease of restriction endonuclease-like RecB superfamily
MKDEKPIQTNHSPGRTHSSSFHPYQLFMRQSHKLGAVATKAFGELKTFLNQEVVLPSAVRLPYSRKIENELQKIEDLKKQVRKSHEVLVAAQTITLFPDEIVVDRTKVTIIKRYSFWSTDVISIQIEDVLNVSASIGILFGSLSIASRVMNTTDHFDVHLLWRRDAIELKQIIQGYAIAKHSGVDVGDLPREEMIETLRELGHDTGM